MHQRDRGEGKREGKREREGRGRRVMYVSRIISVAAAQNGLGCGRTRREREKDKERGGGRCLLGVGRGRQGWLSTRKRATQIHKCILTYEFLSFSVQPRSHRNLRWKPVKCFHSRSFFFYALINVDCRRKAIIKLDRKEERRKGSDGTGGEKGRKVYL